MFRNLHPIAPGLRDLAAPRPTLSEFICHSGRRVPGAPLPTADPRVAWSRAPGSGLRATWLGHSTVLIEIDGCRLLTDPVWGPRASPTRLAGPKRFQPVPVALKALPTIDVVLLSHDHYDHLDYPTVRELAKMGVPFAARPSVRSPVRGGCRPTTDWKAPTSSITRSNGPSRSATSRYCALNPVSPLKNTRCRAERTTSDDHSVALRSGVFLPVHWGTFSLALHDWDDPAETLLRLAPEVGAPLLMPRLGEAVEPAHTAAVEPWWRGVHAPRRGKTAVPEVDPAPRRAPPWPAD